MRFFFYGTLIDPDVRAHVLRDLAPAAVEPATLPGWRRFAAKGVTFPIARPDPKAAIDGVLARGLSAEAGRRLDVYEGPGYRRTAVDVTAGGKRVAAVLYVDDGSGTLTAAPGTWDYETWVRRHKKAFMATLARQAFAPR
jgi:gamma-glutamylcyclotransferase (GGCT)/AIG2-like uncharacterized protein YtfP